MVGPTVAFPLALPRRLAGKSTTGTTGRIATRLPERAGKGEEGVCGKSSRLTSPLMRQNASLAGSFMSAFRPSRSSPGDHTSEPWRWPRGIRSFRGYNLCFTPCLMTTGAQGSCTRFQKVLSLFQPTFRLHNTSSLPQVLLPEPRLPGRDRRPRILCSSTLTKFQNTVRPCLFRISDSSEGKLLVFSDTTKRPLWQAGDLPDSGPPGYRFPRGAAWKTLLQELPAIQRLLCL